MRRSLAAKVAQTIAWLKQLIPRIESPFRFIAFSTGKDSLAMAAMLYEAIAPKTLPCVYVHHNLEFSCNLDYVERCRQEGFDVHVVSPNLEYFELTERGIGFLTLADPWCVPMLVGTGILNWLQQQGAHTPREAVMFRGMSESEYSHKFHKTVELYHRLDLPCINPILRFRREEVLEVIQDRYGLPLNPIYEHMDRTYCICCYTSDQKRQTYSGKHHPEICGAYYRHIEQLLFDSGLIDKAKLRPEYRTKEEKLDKHGFVYWRRHRDQDTPGAVKVRRHPGMVTYHLRDPSWIDAKHLIPALGRHVVKGAEARFWDIPERESDAIIKRMINCLDCGFCIVECLRCRRFCRETKTLTIQGCLQCGKCRRLTFCMGWRHRFWRRTITDSNADGHTPTTFQGDIVPGDAGGRTCADQRVPSGATL